jgi:hypothetical protein
LFIRQCFRELERKQKNGGKEQQDNCGSFRIHNTESGRLFNVDLYVWKDPLHNPFPGKNVPVIVFTKSTIR